MPGLKSKFSDVSDISSCVGTVGTLPGTYPNSMVAIPNMPNGGLFHNRGGGERLPVDADGNEYVPDSQPPVSDDTQMRLESPGPTAVEPEGMDCDDDDNNSDTGDDSTGQGYKRKASSPLSPLPEDYLRNQARGTFGLKAAMRPSPNQNYASPKKGRKVTPNSAGGRRHSERIKARVNIVAGEPQSPLGKRRARGRAGGPSS